jgi:hypothetical protein
MPYRPKFCCQCGEKIERVDWNPLTSRRFCELCATDFGFYDKIPIFVAAAGVLIGLFGIGTYFRAPEKNPNFQPAQLVGAAPVANQTEIIRANQTAPASSNRSVQTLEKTKTEIVPAKQNLKSEKSERAEAPAQEAVYFCGAMTKKGTPCSRKVKNGGRCWQHEGQTAMMPQEKLIVASN